MKMFDFSLLKCLTFMLLAFSGVLVFAGECNHYHFGCIGGSLKCVPEPCKLLC